MLKSVIVTLVLERFAVRSKLLCFLLPLLVVTLANCQQSSRESPSPSPSDSPVASAPSPTPAESESSPAADSPSTLISATGVGDAQLGMTLGDLKQKLGTTVEFQVESPFMVDFDAIAISRDGEVQYYILHLAGEPLKDSDTIQGLLTKNPDFRTAEGVGPGSTLQQAEQAYGQVTLSYNTDNESREYARFERQPAANISFGTGNGNAESAGIYTPSGNSYNETQTYKPDATIESVLVVCFSETCAASN